MASSTGYRGGLLQQVNRPAVGSPDRKGATTIWGQGREPRNPTTPPMARTPKHVLKYQTKVIDPVINAKRREIDERIARLAAEMGYVGSAETGYAPAA